MSNMIRFHNDIPLKKCSNAKFMHIAGLPGMNVVNSYDSHFNEEITVVYLGEARMAERVISVGDGKDGVDCFIDGYYKGIENELVAA